MSVFAVGNSCRGWFGVAWNLKHLDVGPLTPYLGGERASARLNRVVIYAIGLIRSAQGRPQVRVIWRVRARGGLGMGVGSGTRITIRLRARGCAAKVRASCPSHAIYRILNCVFEL